LVTHVTVHEREQFRRAVIAAIRAIPAGSVTNYGELARALGKPGRARLVGRIISEWNGAESGIPFHRVVASDGRLIGGWAFGHPEVMKQLLVDEDVPFRSEYRVDINRCFWSPAADEVHQLDDISRLEDGLDER
jgi:methylated-DNA-protein-cysteine methyltransferase-like protein